MTPPVVAPSLTAMQLLTTLSNAVDLQILGDALEAAHIRYVADHAGMHALMPLPGVMDVQVRVDAADLAAARRILHDLGMDA